MAGLAEAAACLRGKLRALASRRPAALNARSLLTTHTHEQAAAKVGEVKQAPHASFTVQGLREAWAEHKAAQMAEGAPGCGLPQVRLSGTGVPPRLGGNHVLALGGSVQQLTGCALTSCPAPLPYRCRTTQVVYSSRTHSQLQQVMRELRSCGYT